MLSVLGTVVVSGCGPTTAPTPPDASVPASAGAAAPVDFTLTAEALAKEYDANPEAYAAKYKGKRLEVTGVVMTPRQGSGGINDVLLVGSPGAKNFFARAVSVTPRPADRGRYEKLQALAKDQTVTARGNAETHGVVLTGCEFVAAGPSPALVVTPSQLKAAFGTPDGKAKYEGKAVVTRGEVRLAEWNGTVATLMLGDPGVKDGPVLEASINPNEKAVGEAVGKTAVGSVVVALGDAESLNHGRIWNLRVLSAPPEGVTLPGAK